MPLPHGGNEAAVTWRKRQLLSRYLNPPTYPFFRFLRFLGCVSNVMRCRVEQCAVVRCLYVQSCQESCRNVQGTAPNFGLGQCLALNIRTSLGFVVFLSRLQCLTHRTLLVMQNPGSMWSRVKVWDCRSSPTASSRLTSFCR